MGLCVAGGVSSNIILHTLGPLLVGPLGWRNLFIAFSALSLAIVALFWWLGHRPAPARDGEGGPRLGVAGLFRLRIMWAVGGI